MSLKFWPIFFFLQASLVLVLEKVSRLFWLFQDIGIQGISMLSSIKTREKTNISKICSPSPPNFNLWEDMKTGFCISSMFLRRWASPGLHTWSFQWVLLPGSQMLQTLHYSTPAWFLCQEQLSRNWISCHITAPPHTVTNNHEISSASASRLLQGK